MKPGEVLEVSIPLSIKEHYLLCEMSLEWGSDTQGFAKAILMEKLEEYKVMSIHAKENIQNG